MRDGVEVVSVDDALHERATDSLARAFIDDPMWSCVVPDREARRVILRPMWDAVIRYAGVYGEALTTPEAQGVACWIAPGNTKATIWKLLRTGMGLTRSIRHLPKDARARFLAMMRFIDREHKARMKTKHWHLMALGVAPEAQGQGIGTALLAPILERSDVPCYLETETEENVAFYQTRGFEVLGKEAEPACGLPIWFMIREPKR